MKDLFSNHELTKTDETKENYINRAMQLARRAKKELNVPDNQDIDLRQLVVWLNEHKSNINSKSWRQYKSSVIYYLETHPDYQAATEALDYLRNLDSKGTVRTTEKTSSLKLKKITLDDWTKLDTYLTNNQRRKWHSELRVWLRASIITGLRPVEWRNAQFFIHTNGKPALKIENAKHTNGRGHGPTRTLILENVKEEDILAIKVHLNNIRGWVGMGNYDYFYRGCATALYKASRRCWPRRKRHITLYSTRHQFSANAKSSGMSRLEVAALMGHAVDETATTHYGRKQAGNEELGVIPLEDDVNRVKHITIEEFANKIKKPKDILINDLTLNKK